MKQRYIKNYTTQSITSYSIQKCFAKSKRDLAKTKIYTDLKILPVEAKLGANNKICDSKKSYMSIKNYQIFIKNYIA